MAHWAGMEALDWALYWALAAAVATVSGWFATTGRAARTSRTARAWGKYVADVAIIATAFVLVVALVTNGRGCVRSTSCFCDESDVACIEQYCR